MGNWIDVFFSLRFARDGRLVQRGVLHLRQTVRVYDYNLLSLFWSLYGGVDWRRVLCFVCDRLYRHFDGTVPIGLVDASWGGKTIESFAPPTAMVRFRPRLPLNSIPPVLEYRNTTQITPPNHWPTTPNSRTMRRAGWRPAARSPRTPATSRRCRPRGRISGRNGRITGGGKGRRRWVLFLFPYFYLLRTGDSTDVVFCLLLGGPELRRRLH